jgi:hypothetical protein
MLRAAAGGGLAAALLTALLSITFAQSPTPNVDATPPKAPDWIQGSSEERFELVSKHLRGLDMAMVETGYRYSELYWAGRDRNWEFAAYQLDKIRYTLELGLERRPKRAASAQVFLAAALPQMKEAIERKDAEFFNQRFTAFTAACNTCHAMEKVAFMQVAPPRQRLSPIQFSNSNSTER